MSVLRGRSEREQQALVDESLLRMEAAARRDKARARQRSRTAEMLEEFHSHPNSIGHGGTNGLELRRALTIEEHEELVEALDLADPAKIARELADVVYVAYGTAWAWGIDLDAALAEIHRAAMDKMRAGVRREDGKIMKPPGFVPPDMSKAIGARS